MPTRVATLQRNEAERDSDIERPNACDTPVWRLYLAATESPKKGLINLMNCIELRGDLGTLAGRR